MRTRSGNLGSFIMTLLLLLFGAGLVYGNAFKPEIGQLIADTLKYPVVGAGLGLIMILSVVLRWIGGLGKTKNTFINFDSEDGNVGISTKAICDFIERVGREFAAIKEIESKLLHGRDGVDIAIAVKVQTGNRIPELTHVLQQRVRESVRESLGLESIRNITIKVKEIVGDPGKRAAPESQA